MNKSKAKHVSVIFDTDMDSDCDDVGALAVLHALMDLGEVNIVGIICDVPLKASADCVVAINKYYGRADIPVGLLYEEDYENGKKYQDYRKNRQNVSTFRDLYIEKVAHEFNTDKISREKYWDPVLLYRHLLSESEDHSVVIIAVGFLTVLSKLLDSVSDEISPLSGEQLIKKKVKKLVTMGMGKFPSCYAQFNWRMDWEAAKRVINNWPTELIVQINGTQILTGKSLSIKTPPSNPVRKCYEIYLRKENKGHYSWDHITVLYGVRGANPYFEELRGYRIILDENEFGKNYWIEDNSGKPPHIYLKLKNPKKLLMKEIETLMIKLPNIK
ncbi:MAG: hypothetical protein EU532_14640 [Promethearchaeota archaeon]|nr:MAG: hypothetical protein EU532_14640 [Candidatus Lokiarchaeota archaeon]